MRMRYFYTCPLKAAYMAKYFGMRFEPIETGFNKIEHWTSLMAELEDCHCIEEDRAREKYHICHDSLAILEPMDGDINSDADIYGSEKHWFNYDLPIIQRNNQPFFWPESEQS